MKKGMYLVWSEATFEGYWFTEFKTLKQARNYAKSYGVDDGGHKCVITKVM